MRRGDLLWGGILAVLTAGLMFPASHQVFLSATRTYPYLMGFLKVGILATMGELLARRIGSGTWNFPGGLPWRFTVWGFFGMAFVLVFAVFAEGTRVVMGNGLLPGLPGEYGARFSQAFFTSCLMNGIFAPTFMALHRVTDGFIDLGAENPAGIRSATLDEVIDRIDWKGFCGFVILRTIPLFWIPAHTITFLLPPEYRVLSAAYLSIALGGILAFAKLRKSSGERHGQHEVHV